MSQMKTMKSAAKVRSEDWKDRDQDIHLRGGGWVRTWSSIDKPRKVCIEVHHDTYCNRMTRSELQRLIRRLNVLLPSTSKPLVGKRAPQRDIRK